MFEGMNVYRSSAALKTSCGQSHVGLSITTDSSASGLENFHFLISDDSEIFFIFFFPSCPGGEVDADFCSRQSAEWF